LENSKNQYKSSFLLFLNYILEYHLQIEKNIHDLKNEDNIDDSFADLEANNDDNVMMEQGTNTRSIDITNIIEVSCKRMITLKKLLCESLETKTNQKIQTQSNINQCRKEKIMLVSFIGNLCKISNHNIDLKINEDNLLLEIVKLIRDFPFNNILHVHVLKVIVTVFNERSSNILANKLIDDGFLVEFLY